MSDNPVDKKLKLLKSINLENVLTVIFMLLAILFSAYLTSGFDMSLDVFTDYAFYGKTGTNFVIMMFVYNLIKRMIIKKEKSKKGTPYSLVKERQLRFVKRVRDDHLEHTIEEKVAAENVARRNDANQDLLDAVTYGLTPEDVLIPKPVYESIDGVEKLLETKPFNLETFAAQRGLNWRRRRKLRKAVFKVRNGKAEYEELNVHDILVDTSADRRSNGGHPQMKINEKAVDALENRNKALVFLITTAVANSLIWSGLSANFWACMLTQTMLILGSLLSGVFAGYGRVGLLILTLENKCGFLNTALEEQLIKKPLEAEIPIIENKPLAVS